MKPYLLLLTTLLWSCIGQNVDKYNDSGIAKDKLGDYKGAIIDFNKAIKINSNDTEAYYNRGLSKYHLKDYIGAIEDFDKTLEINPKNEEVYLFRGKAKEYIENYEGSLADYSNVIAINPNNKEANNGVIEESDKTLKKNPNSIEAYVIRGRAKVNLNDFKGAIDDFNKALEINSNYTEAYLNRAIAKDSLDDFTGATLDLDKAIKIKPDYADAYYNRGITKIYKKDYNKALSDFNKALEINPNYTEVYIKRGLLKYFNEDYSGAIADLDKAIEIDPNDAVVYYNRGITKNELKDYSGAKEDFDKALAIDPNITESLKAHLDGNNSKADAQAWLERRSTATDEQVARLQAIVRTYLAGAHFIDVNGDGKVGVEDLVWAKDASGNINVQHVDNVLADRVRVDAAVVHACYLMAKAKHEYATLEEMRVSSTYWTPTLQDGFVRVREGERASAAINDIFENPKQYRLGSNQATTIVYLKAMLDLLGPKDFDRVVPHLIMGPWSLTAFVKETVEVTGNAHQNADPEFRAEIRAGDEAYFKNLSATAEARATRGAAQHAIYLGDGKWYAHPFGITTEKGIIDYLNLSSRPGAEGLARMTRARTRMNVDILEEDKVSNWNKTHY